LLDSRELQLPEKSGCRKSTTINLVLPIYNHYTIATPKNMSADVSASSLFHVNGLVAVITGGGTGSSHSQHNFQPTKNLQASAS
jgi:hypothetical protein